MPPAKVDKSIKNYLLDFGLTEKEVKLYLTLLKSGPNTIMNLARETGIKRSTTHNNIEELIKKGLVSQTNYGERRMVVAEHPEKLTFLMDQKRWDVKKLEEILPDVITRIVETVPEAKETTKVEVKYYEGKKGVMYVYDEVLKSKKIRSFVNVDKIRSVLPDNIELFADAIKKRNDIEMWEILEDSTKNVDLAEDFTDSKYHYKFIAEGNSLYDTDIIIFDDKIAFISVEQEKVTAVVMYSVSLASALANVHNMIWNLI